MAKHGNKREKTKKTQVKKVEGKKAPKAGKVAKAAKAALAGQPAPECECPSSMQPAAGQDAGRAKQGEQAASASISPDRFDEMRARLQARVKPSRYRHSLGVSQTAEQLARIYGADRDAAAVAGLLHDWDKALTLPEVAKKAKRLKLADKSVRRDMPGVLHSFTAAATLRDEFPDLSDAVLQAIARHTCGAVDMTDLDMIVFVADIIEPGRTFPDIAELRAMVGRVSLEELFYETYKANLIYLLGANLCVYPDSLKVHNAYALRRAGRMRERRECEQAGKQAGEQERGGDKAPLQERQEPEREQEPERPEQQCARRPRDPHAPRRIVIQ